MRTPTKYRVNSWIKKKKLNVSRLEKLNTEIELETQWFEPNETTLSPSGYINKW